MQLPEPLVVLILAVLQGVAEFLPISSSGHLVVLERLLGSDGGKSLVIMLHLGTLISIAAFYWKRIVDLLRSDWRVIPLLVVASVPAAVAGFLLKKDPRFDAIFGSPVVAGAMFIVTGILLLLFRTIREGKTEYQQMGAGRAFAVGLAQMAALLPGISRSGATIVAGSAVGLNRPAAATWSFLMAIPVTAGVVLLELKDLLKGEAVSTTPPLLLVMGIIVSAVVGYASLCVLVRMLNSGHLHWFALWLIPFGVLILVLAWAGMLPPEVHGPESLQAAASSVSR